MYGSRTVESLTLCSRRQKWRNLIVHLQGRSQSHTPHHPHEHQRQLFSVFTHFYFFYFLTLFLFSIFLLFLLVFFLRFSFFFCFFYMKDRCGAPSPFEHVLARNRTQSRARATCPQEVIRFESTRPSLPSPPLTLSELARTCPNPGGPVQFLGQKLLSRGIGSDFLVPHVPKRRGGATAICSHFYIFFFKHFSKQLKKQFLKHFFLTHHFQTFIERRFFRTCFWNFCFL